MSKWEVKNLFMVEYRFSIQSMDRYSLINEFKYFAETLFENGVISEKVFNSCLHMK